MKRNRLLKSSYDARLFSNERASYSKRRHFLILSVLTIIGVFLTTVVLTSNASVNSDIKSQVISLPGQNTTFTTPSASDIEIKPLALSTPLPSQQFNNPEINRVPAPVEVEQASALETEALEQRYHLNIQSVESDDSIISNQQVALNDQALELPLNWQEVTVENGDNLSLIFPRVGLSARDVYNVVQADGDIKSLLNLKPEQVIQFATAEDNSGNTVLMQLSLQLSPIETLQLTATDDGYTAETHTRDVDYQQSAVAGEIQSSLFAAGAEAGMSDKLIMELAHIFGWDIDFALDLRQGDSFKIIYDEEHLDGEKINDGNILAAEFTNRGKTYRAVRYTNIDGDTHYYTPEGNSMRRTFTRTPVHFTRISSNFNPNRKHPIFKTNRPHRGVDYAAPTGTPILATGNGTVAFVGTKGGYGQTVVLAHGSKYSTLYAHLSRFKSGLKTGQRIKQGEVIGYVGMTGYATGPHLHYEFHINGVHQNPLTVALPGAEPLTGKHMTDFKEQAQSLLAKLDDTDLPRLAFNQSQ